MLRYEIPEKEADNYITGFISVIMHELETVDTTTFQRAYLDEWRKKEETTLAEIKEEIVFMNRKLGDIQTKKVEMDEKPNSISVGVYRSDFVETVEIKYEQEMYDVMQRDVVRLYQEIIKELTDVLENIDSKAKDRSYLLEFSQLEDNNVGIILEGILGDEKTKTKEALYLYLWEKVFCDPRLFVDFRDIYVMIVLFNEHGIRLDIPKDMQKIELPKTDEILQHGKYYFKSQMEALIYLLETCPYLSECLVDSLKSKLKMVCTKNLTYLVRGGYIFDSLKTHLQAIEKEKEKIYAGNGGIDTYSECVWTSEDFEYLRKQQNNENDMQELDEYVKNLFCNSISYNMSAELWKYVKNRLGDFNYEQLQEINVAIKQNSQIRDRQKSPDIVREFYEICEEKLKN